MFLSPQPVYRILDKQRNQRLLFAHNVYKILFPETYAHPPQKVYFIKTPKRINSKCVIQSVSDDTPSSEISVQ